MNLKIEYPNSGDSSIIDYVLGRFQWYRRWRKGYWWCSTCTNTWWRHKDQDDEEQVEDYR